MKPVLIALLLCAVGGCASRPALVEPRIYLDCGVTEMPYAPPRLRLAKVSFQIMSAVVASPERLSVREEMIGLVRAGKLKTALAIGEVQLALQEGALKAGGHDEAGLAGLMTDVGELQQALQHLGPAAKRYRRAIALYARVHADGPEALRPVVDLAILYRRQGKTALALALQRDAYPKLLAWLGPEHPDVLESEGELVRLLFTFKQYEEAKEVFQVRLDRAELAGDETAIANNRKMLAKIRRAQARPRTS
ncbi:MAG: tetratricopeptide repeat protein [Pseudomonadota bacterium]